MSNSKPDIMKMWNFNNPKETEENFSQLLPGAISTGDINYYHQLLSQLARAKGLQQKFEEAHECLDLIADALDNCNSETQVLYSLERGRTLNSNEKPDVALPFFRDAFELAKAEKLDGFAVDALHMLAIADSQNKEKWETRALEFVEKSKDPKALRWKGTLLNNLGWSKMDKESFNEAEAYFVKALDWYKEFGSENGLKIAHWAVGRVKRSLGKLDDALEIHKMIIDKMPPASGYVYEEMGEIYLVQGKELLAKEAFSQAFELLKDDVWLQRDEAERLERIKKLGS